MTPHDTLLLLASRDTFLMNCPSCTQQCENKPAWPCIALAVRFLYCQCHMKTALMICADVLGMRPGQYMVCPYLLLHGRHSQLATASLLWAIWLPVFAMVVQGH